MRPEPVRSIIGEKTYDFEWNERELSLDGEPFALDVVPLGQDHYVIRLNGVNHTVVAESRDGDEIVLRRSDGLRSVRVLRRRDILLADLGIGGGSTVKQLQLKAPMPGLVLSINVETGQHVTQGEGLVVLEAMKMENELKAAQDGIVATVHVAAGEAVTKNAVLIDFEG